MPKVASQRTNRSSSAIRTRRASNRPIACSGCGGNSECRCLNPHQLSRELLAATRRFLTSGTDLAKRREARAALADVVAREDQRVREEEALRAFCRAYTAPKGYSTRRDRYAVWHMFGEYTGVVPCGAARSVERTAELFRRPVAYMRALRDDAMQALTAAAAPTASRRAA